MSQGRDETRIKEEIHITLMHAVGGGLAYRKLDEKTRKRIERARDGLYGIFLANGLRPEPSAMKHTHHPAQSIPERNVITFWQHEYPALIVEPRPYEVALADNVIEWLNARAPGWTATFDRGDWGEGEPQVELVLPHLRQVLGFMEEFGKRPSPPQADGSDLENDDLYEDVPLEELLPPGTEKVELSPSSITVVPQDGRDDGG